MLNFPKKEENLSQQDPHIAHKHLVDYHLHFLRLQSKCELFNWKLMGVFFLSSLSAFFLSNKGMIANPLIQTSTIGLGCLFVFAQNTWKDLEYAASSASCVQMGICLENQSASPSRLFKIFEDNKTLLFRSNLLSRSVPFVFIGLSTIIACAGLTKKIGIWAAITASTLIIIGIWAFANHYINVLKKLS